ncbi:MAG: rod shape-determining protein MreC [Gammaproteobacteria bacterium]
MALTTSERQPATLRDSSPGLRIILVTVLSIAIMVLDHQNQHLVSVRKALSIALYPIQFIVNTPSSLGRTLAENFATRDDLWAENHLLKSRLLSQSAQLQTMDALRAENTRLRALLDSTQKVDNNVLIAEVMSIDMDPYRHIVLLNKGGQDGVIAGQAIIDSQGVVGQITRDLHFSSEALLLTDINHAIPVEIVRNGLRSIAVGTGELDRLSLPFLPRNADILKGDLLVTSGLGGAFPAGYLVGKVTTVSSITGQPFLVVEATPAAALDRIREVLLVRTAPEADPEVSPAETDSETAGENVIDDTASGVQD